MIRIFVMVLVCVFTAISARAEDIASVQATALPKVNQVVGSGDIHLSPVIEPTYSGGSCPHPAVPAAPSGPTKIDDLVQIVKIPSAYSKTARILVNWTIRVEGRCNSQGSGLMSFNKENDGKDDPAGQGMLAVLKEFIESRFGPDFAYACSSSSTSGASDSKLERDSDYSGPPVLPTQTCSTMKVTCPSGDVKSYLYVNDVKKEGVIKGPPYVIRIPEADGGTITCCTSVPPQNDNNWSSSKEVDYDPTLTGSYLIKPSDFGGSLPAEIRIQVAWQNFTSMTITCPDQMRNLLTHVMYVVKES